MTIGQGFTGRIGVIKEAVYGTILEVTEAIPFVSESFGDTIENYPDEVLRGYAGRGTSITGNKLHPFTIPSKLTYQDLDLLIAIAMGAAGTPQINGTLYDNTYSLAESLDYSLTMAVYKGVAVWEYAGCKIDTMKISGESNKPLDFEFSGAAKALDMASATNTTSILTALTAEDAVSKIMFTDLEFKIAAQADVLSGESESGLSSFELSLSNNLVLDQFDNRANTVLEPVRNGFRDVKFNFTVPRYEANTYHAWHAADTALHAQLKFTRGNYLFDIHIPDIKIEKTDAPVSGPGLISQSIECTCCLDIGNDSTSFTPLTEEFEIDVTNGRSASPLA